MINKSVEINNICKEVITYLSFFENDFINKIPDKVLAQLSDFAADSTEDYYVDMEKDLINQNISEEAKDLIASLYYQYILNETGKNEILEVWKQNQKTYQEELNEKYNIDNIFKKVDEPQNTTNDVIENNTNTLLVEYKESFFTKIKNFIFKLLHINN